MNPALPTRELRALTGLRFFAAALVVFYHFGAAVATRLPRAGQNIIHAGYSSVGLFFVLSGFVLAWNYSERAVTPTDFWKARFARIYPAYFLSLLLAAPFVLSDPRALKVGLGAVFVLPMVQAWTPWTASLWNPPAWSLSVEAFFYLTFPWLVARLTRVPDRSLLRLSLAAWGGSLAVAGVYLALHPGGSGWRLDSPTQDLVSLHAIKFLPLLHLPEFLMGMVAGILCRRNPAVAHRSSRVWLWLGLAVSGGVLASSDRVPYLLLHNGLLSPAFALLVPALALGQSRLGWFLSLPAIHLLGEASYGVYILQAPLSRWWEALAPLQSTGEFWLFLAFLTLASVLSFQFLERPCRKWLRQRLASRPRQTLGLGAISLSVAHD
jgi:peptidoglycan/LPS O-acetylase OafA/YrhL